MAMSMRVFRSAFSLLVNSSQSLRLRVGCCVNVSLRSSISTESPGTSQQLPAEHNVKYENPSAGKKDKINKAMKAYLERAQAHDKFMEEEIAEFEIGKRHLANIMGADPDMFTQEDIDKAVEYLLPSGLFDKKARPKLKHPTDILPKRKAAQFGMDGRPFDYLFYTGKPKFFQVLHEMAIKVEELKKFEDTQLSKGNQPDSNDQLLLAGSQWMEKEVLEKKFQETISDTEYAGFLIMAEHVAKQPYSVREKDYVFQFRHDLQKQSLSQDVPAPRYDEGGRAYQEAQGIRKEAVAFVKLFDRGTGKISINGKDFLEYFPRLADREQVLFPLHLTDHIGAVDLEATVEQGGPSGQAGAIRLALSRALTSIVNKDTAEKMRLAGLLTLDPRILERKKPGQKGARRKYTWKKR